MIVYTRNFWGKESLRKAWDLSHFEQIQIETNNRDKIAEIAGATLMRNDTFLLAYHGSTFAILDMNSIGFLQELLDDIILAMAEDRKVYDVYEFYNKFENRTGLLNSPSFESWFHEQYKKNRKAKIEILRFIWNFVTHDKNPESFRVLEHQFTTGYCYHFAVIMKKMFGGKIVWHKGHSHILWQDRNKVIYDIRGVYTNYYNLNEIVPVSELGDELDNYLHK